jgi:uncharacterized protein YcfJ
MRPQTLIFCAVLPVVTMVSGNARANGQPHAGATYPAYAEVVRAEKVSHLQHRRTPIKRCTWEQLPSRVTSRYRYGEPQVVERRAKRCRTVYETRSIEQITGYDVTLRYNGEIFTRRMQVHPGVRVPVTIEITPLNQP